VSDPAEAEDLAQETWLVALRAPPHSAATVRLWLRQVFVSRLRDARRARQRRGAREQAATNTEQSSTIRSGSQRGWSCTGAWRAPWPRSTARGGGSRADPGATDPHRERGEPGVRQGAPPGRAPRSQSRVGVLHPAVVATAVPNRSECFRA
jgi:hypothetical protein